MTNYKINSRNQIRFDGNTYTIVSATFFRASGDLSVVELYKVVDGLEMFAGYLRADCTPDLLAKGPAARAAADWLVFDERARAA